MATVKSFADIPKGARVFVDANTFVYHFTSAPTFGAAATNLLTRIESEEIEGLTTPHIMAEASHRLMTIEACASFGWPFNGVASRLKRHHKDIARLARFRQAVSDIVGLDLNMIEVRSADVLRAADVSRQFGLLTNDAIIVAIMQRLGLASLASNDEDFDRVPTIARYAPL